MFTKCTYQSFWCQIGEIMGCLISMPIMEGSSGDSQPEKSSHNIHDRVRQLTLMLCRAKEVCEELDHSVDQKTDDDARCNDFSIWWLFLVEVPSSADTQEITAISESIQYQDDDVQNLIINESLLIQMKNIFPLYRTTPRWWHQEKISPFWSDLFEKMRKRRGNFHNKSSWILLMSSFAVFFSLKGLI